MSWYRLGTLGFESELEGGAEYKLSRSFRVGASLYDVLPYGNQKVFSRLFREQPPVSPSLQANHARIFETRFETTGPESLIKDNGYSAWIGFSPYHHRSIDFEVGYNRSVRFALDSFSFRIGINALSLIKKMGRVSSLAVCAKCPPMMWC